MDGQKACKNMIILTNNYGDEIKTIERYSLTSMLLAMSFKFDTIKYLVGMGNYF